LPTVGSVVKNFTGSFLGKGLWGRVLGGGQNVSYYYLTGQGDNSDGEGSTSSTSTKTNSNPDQYSEFVDTPDNVPGSGEEPVTTQNDSAPGDNSAGGESDGKAWAKGETSTKPANSPDPEKWIGKGGKLDILPDGTWRYTDWEGNVVDYTNGYPNFEPYSRQSVDIGKQEGNYTTDFTNAEANSTETPPRLTKDETVWHHHEDGKTMQEVIRTVHDRFTHKGGVSLGKKVSLGNK
jgi:hypothetical protein